MRRLPTGEAVPQGPGGAVRLVDLDEHPEMRSIVEQRNGGAMVIPTIVLPDGSHLAEPTNEELAAKVGLRPGFT